MLDISIYQKPFEIFGVNVGFSVVVAWCVIAALIVLLLFVRRAAGRFQEVPHGFQNVIEFAVEGIYDFARSKVGRHADSIAPFALTFIFYIFFTTIIDLFGIPPATEDINCTFALGLCSFIMVNVEALRFKGLKGRIKALAAPVPYALPIRILTDCVAPVSMGIRLFANVFVGGVIMQLVYMVFPLVVPAILASYFNVLHIGIQVFIFAMLSLTFAGEAVEQE